MPLTTSGFANLLDPAFREIFFNEYNDLVKSASLLGTLYNMMTSEKGSEKFSSIGSSGKMSRMDRTGKVQYDNLKPEYDKTVEFPEYVNGFVVQRKLWDDEQYGILQQGLPEQLALSVQRTREYYAALIFNNCTSTTVTDDQGYTIDIATPDTVCLASASHTWKTGDTTAVDNLGALALSAANMDTVRQKMRNFRDDRGNLVYAMPDTLMVPPELEKSAREVLGSVNIPGEFSNTINVERAHGYNLIVWDWLTDSNRWFMIDSKMMKRSLFWVDRVAPEFNLVPADAETFERRWNAYARWGFTVMDWRWLVMSEPS